MLPGYRTAIVALHLRSSCVDPLLSQPQNQWKAGKVRAHVAKSSNNADRGAGPSARRSSTVKTTAGVM